MLVTVLVDVVIVVVGVSGCEALDVLVIIPLLLFVVVGAVLSPESTPPSTAPSIVVSDSVAVVASMGTLGPSVGLLVIASLVVVVFANIEEVSLARHMKRSFHNVNLTFHV